MYNNGVMFEKKSITVAQLCEALSSGALPAQLENGEYLIRRRDLKQFAEGRTPSVRVPTSVPVLFAEKLAAVTATVQQAS